MSNKEKLIEFIENCLNRKAVDNSQNIWAHQAFGAVHLYCILFPEERQEIELLWNEKYRFLFFK